MPEHIRYARNRREFLTDCFCGVGSLAFASMMAQEQARAARLQSARAEAAAHSRPRRRRSSSCFMAGGPSHLETFDPKPLLNKLHGQKRPAEFGEVEVSERQRRRRGCSAPSGRSRSTASRASRFRSVPASGGDRRRLCVIRSMHGDMVVHSAAQYQMMTGRVIPGFPSMGSWMVYGLGSEAESLPAYVVMPDPHGAPEAGTADVHATAFCRRSISRRCSGRATSRC